MKRVEEGREEEMGEGREGNRNRESDRACAARREGEEAWKSRECSFE